MMKYKGYVATVEVDLEGDLLHGEVLGIRDVVTFEGQTPAEVERAFRDSVDDYLDFCKQRGEAPDKPFSGKFVIRLDPALHRVVSSVAQAKGKSLNAWVGERLAEGVEREIGGARKERKKTKRSRKAG